MDRPISYGKKTEPMNNNEQTANTTPSLSGDLKEASFISQSLSLPRRSVSAVLILLNEGCTIPFISRYRKERTGNLNEVQITDISELYDRLKELAKRKETILKTIREQGKLTTALEAKIQSCMDATELEDIYLPYKPKRRTRAQIAREQGLEPLAMEIMSVAASSNPSVGRRTALSCLSEKERDKLASAWQEYQGGAKGSLFVHEHVDISTLLEGLGEASLTLSKELEGALDIIAEIVSENQQARNTVRTAYHRGAIISSKVIKKMKETDEAQKFSDYFDFSEPLRRCNSHRLLAMRRGESQGILRVSITIEGEECVSRLTRQFVRGHGLCQALVSQAVEDSFKRLINPSMENEFAALSKERADEEAIKVFTENLRQLLLSPPLGQKRVLALDPGFANGCKIACLDEQGTLLHHEIIYPHPPRNQVRQATEALQRMIKTYKIEAIAIGNGTASRESETFISNILQDTTNDFGNILRYVVSEDGASIYSASPVAREEFPDEDVTTRGAVSIGRRLMDPLAELVKIEPKAIGVGQYQHDMNQNKLEEQLNNTVEDCVNRVGVDLNTASAALLSYISGINKTLAKNIVVYREENGAFKSRKELLKVAKLGPKAFEQSAGFLRIREGKEVLDRTSVHPESYQKTKELLSLLNLNEKDIAEGKGKDIAKMISALPGGMKALEEKLAIGSFTLKDIVEALAKPGRDPREDVPAPILRSDVLELSDLKEGMILEGTVRNVLDFGAFVDIGVHQDGLVHISALSKKFVKHPLDVVKLGDIVKVKILSVDMERKKISLSMKDVE